MAQIRPPIDGGDKCYTKLKLFLLWRDFIKKKALSISALLVIMMLASAVARRLIIRHLPATRLLKLKLRQNPYKVPNLKPHLRQLRKAINYSAEAVMKLVDELIVKHPYNKPEHIKALVIAGNLDYISKEDMDIILGTYGYTMLIAHSVGLSIMDADAEFHETVINSTSFTNIESFVYCYTIGVLHPNISYTDFVNSPFTTYQSTN